MTMEQAESLSMEGHFPMKTLISSTLVRESYRWPTPARTPMGLSFSFVQRRHRGWTVMIPPICFRTVELFLFFYNRFKTCFTANQRSNLGREAIVAVSAGRHVVFGQVVEGFSVVKAIEAVGSRSGETSEDVIIEECGILESAGPAAGTSNPGATQAVRTPGTSMKRGFHTSSFSIQRPTLVPTSPNLSRNFSLSPVRGPLRRAQRAAPRSVLTLVAGYTALAML